MCALRILQRSLPLRALLPKLIDHSSVLAFLHKQICNNSLAGQYFSTMAFVNDKEKYLALSLDEKRKVYKSSGGYCTLEDVKTWPSYFQSNQERLVQQYEDSKEKIGLEKYDARPELADKISLWKGDITTLEIDAIVNAANSTLLGGGGVDGAIHRAAGGSLKAECKTLNGCKVGEAKITGGYMLPAKYVIHTVGPQGEIPTALQGCYDSCLNLLRDQKLKSIAFPCISTGIYGYPQEAAAKVALKTVRAFMEQNHEEVDRIIFCLFLPTDVSIYENLLQVFFPTS